MNENQPTIELGETPGDLPQDFDYDLFLKGTLETMGSLFGQNRMNTASISAIDSAITNAMDVGYRFERALRPVKRAAGKKKS